MSQTQQPLPSTCPAPQTAELQLTIAVYEFERVISGIAAMQELQGDRCNLSSVSWGAAWDALLASMPRGSRAMYFAARFGTVYTLTPVGR